MESNNGSILGLSRNVRTFTSTFSYLGIQSYTSKTSSFELGQKDLNRLQWFRI
jgi:hypothetical protein